MKRIIAALIGFTVLAFLAWPYATLYRLDGALASQDLTRLDQFVDVVAVRDDIKRRVSVKVGEAVGGEPGTLLGWIQEGVRQIGGRAVDIAVDLEWIRDTLAGVTPPAGGTFKGGRPANGAPIGRSEGTAGSLLSRVSYALPASWDRFIVRTRPVDDEALELEWHLRQWRWQVVAVRN